MFLSGNGPLVAVLREALARDRVVQARARGEKLAKRIAKSETSVFVQNIHHFRDEYLRILKSPIETLDCIDTFERTAFPIPIFELLLT